MPDDEPLPPHVFANVMLAHELEAAYLNRRSEFRLVEVHSTTARKHFRNNDSRNRYFDRLAEARALPVAEVPQLKPYCLRCWNSGSVIGWRGGVVPCPMPDCAARLPVIERFNAANEVDRRLGLVAVGESQCRPGLNGGMTGQT